MTAPETAPETGAGARAGLAGAVVQRIRAFFAFWYDFVIGDDWRIAAGVVVALAATYGLSRTSVPAWWLLPLVVAAMLAVSLWFATRRRR